MPFKDATQCNAKAKSTGKQCNNPAMNGSTKCRLHGGKTPRGSASPNWKGKGRSKYLPQRLADSYQELEADTEYTDLRANMRLREVFIREKLAMLDESADSMEAWTAFRKLWNDITKAFANKDYGMVLVLMNQGEQIIDERLIYFMTHKEIRADLAEQRKDSQAIASIEYKGENAVTAGELMTFVSAVLNFVSTHVTNPNEQQAVFSDVQNLLTIEPNNRERISRLTDG